MDNINDLENSSKEQLVEKVESMQEEIDSLKEENSKAKSNLMWKVRKLEKDKVLIENEKIRLERETKSLRSEVERFRSPPLVLATITEVLAKGDKLSLVGFGTFGVSKREARDGRNPRTGEVVRIEARNAVTFKAGTALKDAVNE